MIGMEKMTQAEWAFAIIVAFVILALVGFGIWSTGEAERNRQKDLEIIRICAEVKDAPACSIQR